MTDPFKYVPSTSANPPHYTTNYGAPVWNNTSSLTVGNRGPILLEVSLSLSHSLSSMAPFVPLTPLSLTFVTHSFLFSLTPLSLSPLSHPDPLSFGGGGPSYFFLAVLPTLDSLFV